MNTKKVLSDTNNFERCSFALQKGTFYVVKGALLTCKRRPFTMQKGVF